MSYSGHIDLEGGGGKKPSNAKKIRSLLLIREVHRTIGQTFIAVLEDSILLLIFAT